MPKKRFSRHKRNKTHKLIKGVRTPSDIEKVIRDMSKTNICPKLKKFLIYTCERQVYGPDKSDEFIIYCLSSYFILGETRYHLLPPFTNFIPIDQIREGACRDFKINAGLKDNLLELIKIKTENLCTQNKVVILSIDESTLNQGLKYDTNLDITIGYEDDGKIRTQDEAKFVTNIWINCLSGTWMMPLAFIFTQRPATPEQIKELIFDSITKLETIGLDVAAIVTKMRANFYELSLQLNISPMNQTFKVGTKDIIFLYDVPQLMNITRNILMKYKLEFDDFITSWTFIKMFFMIDCQNSDRKTNLTINHLKPSKLEKTLPQYAIELLSNTVATEMNRQIIDKKLPEAAEGTAKFLDMMDKLFDILSSSQNISMNQFNSGYKGTKHQVEFLQKIMCFFENLKVFYRDIECTNELKFAKGWLISIRGMMKLWEVVKAKKYSYLLTRNANCEIMDKFTNWTRWTLFGTQNHTPSEFLDWYTKFFISCYFAPDNMPEVNQACHFHVFLKKVSRRIPPTIHNDGHDKENTGNNPATGPLSQLGCQLLRFHMNLECFFHFYQQ